MPICAFTLISSTQCLQNDLSQVLCIVVFARDESVQPTCQPIDGRVVGWIIFIWEDDMEVAIQLLCGDISEVLRNEGEGNEVGGRGLGGSAMKSGHRRIMVQPLGTFLTYMLEDILLRL